MGVSGSLSGLPVGVRYRTVKLLTCPTDGRKGFLCIEDETPVSGVIGRDILDSPGRARVTTFSSMNERSLLLQFSVFPEMCEDSEAFIFLVKERVGVFLFIPVSSGDTVEDPPFSHTRGPSPD